MKRKITVIFLSVVMLTLTLAGCGGSQSENANVTPLPSPTAGSIITTFTGKVTAKKGNSFKIDMQNSTMHTSTYGEASPSPSPSPSPSANPALPAKPSDNSVTKDVSFEVPSNAAITLANGSTGKLSDIKVGNTVTFTLTDSVVTAATVVSTKK